MGKIPYIPIYIGDWEQDTNSINLEAEGALLKLTFKLFKSKTKGSMIISFSQAALLFKKDENFAVKIIKELQENDILNIEFLPENKIKIESRRMLKEAEISYTNSKNGSKGGRPKKRKKSKSKANVKRNTEYENESDNDIVNDNKHEIQVFVETKCREVSKLSKQLTREDCETLLTFWTVEQIVEKLLSMENYKKLTQSYSSVNLTLQKWLTKDFGKTNKEALEPENDDITKRIIAHYEKHSTKS